MEKTGIGSAVGGKLRGLWESTGFPWVGSYLELSYRCDLWLSSGASAGVVSQDIWRLGMWSFVGKLDGLFGVTVGG